MRDFIKTFLKDKTKICPKRLNRKIKEVMIFSCPPKTTEKFLHSKLLFDIDGNKTEFKTYSAGKLITWEKYIYSGDDLIEKLKGKSKWKGGSYNETDFEFSSEPILAPQEKGITETNKEGQKVISTFFATGELESRTVLDENEICIEFLEFSKKNTITYKETYDSKGQLLEARRYKTDGTPLNYTINTYDDQLRLCRSVSISRTGYLTHDVLLKYNAQNLLAETIEHPVDIEKAYADLKDGSNGYSHKYSYTEDLLVDTDNLYLCGELIMSYKYSYTHW